MRPPTKKGKDALWNPKVLKDLQGFEPILGVHPTETFESDKASNDFDLQGELVDDRALRRASPRPDSICDHGSSVAPFSDIVDKNAIDAEEEPPSTSSPTQMMTTAGEAFTVFKKGAWYHLQSHRIGQLLEILMVMMMMMTMTCLHKNCQRVDIRPPRTGFKATPMSTLNFPMMIVMTIHLLLD
jgi:hypothetical protein